MKFPMKTCAVLALAAMSVPAHAADASVRPSSLAPDPQLVLTVPAQVRVGEPLQLSIELQNASAAAGYEVGVQYDTSAVEFGGVSFGSAGTTDGSRRSTITTIAQDLAHGAVFGAFNCLVPGCPQATDPAAERDALEHATLRLEPLVGGSFTFRLGAVAVVDRNGARLPVNVPVTTVTVEVVATDGSLGVHPAPSAPFVLPDASVTGTWARDLNGNGPISYDDVATLVASWTAARERGSCGERADDLDTNGCLDIGDVQLLAAATSGPVIDDRPTSPTVAPGGGPWVVNTTGDQPDTNIGDGACRTEFGECSLRAAIYEANAAPGADVINFAIPGDGVRTIQLAAAPPVINDSSGGTFIDGYSQPGTRPNTDPLVSDAVILIEIRGEGPMISYSPPQPRYDGFRITSANNVVRGLSIYNVFNHVNLQGPAAVNNVIIGNLIGTDTTATFNAPDLQDGGSGVKVHSGANHNIIGRANPADRNVIAGTPSTGIRIEHDGTDANLIQNNMLGLKPAGNEARRVGYSGIDVQFGAASNYVGGPGAMEGNLIVGTPYAGIDISHGENTTLNRVVGNLIGTTPDGNSVTDYTKLSKHGITFKDNAEGNLVYGNVVGGATLDAIFNKQDYTAGNYVYDNRIGVSRSGAPLPNDAYGMFLQGHDFVVGPGNVFANNALGGVLVTSAASLRNRITANAFIGNGGLAIDLAPAGPTANDANDADSGPNTLLNHPLLQPASTTVVTGAACAGCRVEIYKAALDAGNRGEGNRPVGFTTAGAVGAFSAAIVGVSVGDMLAGIAIDAVGNTSEFSPVAAVTTVGAPPPDVLPPDEQPPAPGDDTPAPPSGPPASFVPLVPARLLDSRPGFATVDGAFAGNGVVTAGATVQLTVAGRGGVPLSATAAVLNVTATEADGPGFVTVFPCGSAQPLASSLNYIAGQTVPNAVLAKIGHDGTVCLYTQLTTHLVVDVDGYFPPGSSYVSLSPSRLLDSRPGFATVDGQSAGIGAVPADTVVELTVTGRGNVAATATAVVLNVTATEADGAGFVTVFPCGSQRPLASNLNYVAGQTVANAVIARIGQGGKVCLYTQRSTHLVVDVAGYFPPGSTYDSLVPARLMDTRPGAATADGQFAGGGIVPANSVVELVVAGRGGVALDSQAVVLNVTATDAEGPGYVTVFPCGASRPLASNLNYVGGQTVPNTVVIGIGTGGRVCLYTQLATHLVVDVAGSFGSAF